MEYGECVSLLMGQDNILVLSHIRPDGDTLGSGAALCSALRRAGKTAYIYENPEITDRYLPYVRPWFAPSGFVPDYTVAVDIAEPGLFPLGYAGTVRLCIDHHPSNARYAADLLLRDRKSACGEIVLELIKLLHGAPDRAEATLLYIAISTDTGCFQYSNTNSDTLRAAAETLDAGAGIHDAPVVIAPGEEGNVLAAPLAELGESVLKGYAAGQPLGVEAGEFFHLIVHTLEIDGLHIRREFAGGPELIVQLHGADLDDLTPEVDGQLVENGGLGAHRLIPLQIDHHIVHKDPSFV